MLNIPFVCGFVFLPWNFLLGCSKATLSAPCFLLQPSIPLANTLWAEGQHIVGRGPGPAWLESWALLRWRQFTFRSKTPFGPKPVWGPGNSQRAWLPIDVLVPLCDVILDYLSYHTVVCVAGREGQQRLFVVRDVVHHWTLGSWPPPLVFWRIMPTTLFHTKLEGCIWQLKRILRKIFSRLFGDTSHSGQQSGQNVIVFSGIEWWITVLYCQWCFLNSVEFYSLWGDFSLRDRLLFFFCYLYWLLLENCCILVNLLAIVRNCSLVLKNFWKFRRRKKVATRKKNFEEEGNLFINGLKKIGTLMLYITYITILH